MGSGTYGRKPGSVNAEKILIVQMCRMGDLVQTLPMLKRLKEEKRGCEVTILCIRESMELVQDTRLADRLLPIPYSYFNSLQHSDADPVASDRLMSTRELREEYDLVINLTHDLVSSEICGRVKGRVKSGRIDSPRDKIRVLGDWGKYLFAAVDNRLENLINLVDIHIGMGLIPHGGKPHGGEPHGGEPHGGKPQGGGPAGVSTRAGVPAERTDTWLDVSPGDSRRALEILKAHGYRGKGRLVALQMGANQLHRAWPVAGFAELARRLVRAGDVEIVLFGSPGEKKLGEEFKRLSDFPAIDLIGETRIAELPGIAQRCDILVSNDTGTAHIAAALGTRVLGLYFATAYFGETAPYGEGHVIIQAELPCSPCAAKDRCESVKCRDVISVEAVETAARMMLDGRTGRVFGFPGLSVYRSRFLSNGTLLYAPVSTPVSGRYQAGLISRMLWEKGLGLEHDPEVVREFARAFRCRPEIREEFESRLAAYAGNILHIKRLYRDALAPAHEVVAARRSARPDGSAVSAPEDSRRRIAAVFEDIARMPRSLVRDFHYYEMMDRDHSSAFDEDLLVLTKLTRLYRLADAFVAGLDVWRGGSIPVAGG